VIQASEGSRPPVEQLHHAAPERLGRHPFELDPSVDILEQQPPAADDKRMDEKVELVDKAARRRLTPILVPCSPN
jgi:hypothetical protein